MSKIVNVDEHGYFDSKNKSSYWICFTEDKEGVKRETAITHSSEQELPFKAFVSYNGIIKEKIKFIQTGSFRQKAT